MVKAILFPVFWLLILGKGLGQNHDEISGDSFISQSEKIYIHYDKEFFIAGETVWLKAYLYNNGLPSSLSNNFFMQLLDAAGTIVCTKHYPVQGSAVIGNIDLPDSLPGGYYFINAQTAAIMNLSDSIIYSKAIYIYNPTKEEKVPSHKKESQNAISLQFFPESGNMIDGVLTTVGLKVVDNSGYHVDISGVGS